VGKGGEGRLDGREGGGGEKSEGYILWEDPGVVRIHDCVTETLNTTDEEE